MNINYELIAVLATGLFIIGCIVIHELRLEKKNSNYKKYLDSFMIGDIFELKLVDELRENPFYDEKESNNAEKYRELSVKEVKKLYNENGFKKENDAKDFMQTFPPENPNIETSLLSVSVKLVTLSPKST